MSVPPEPPERTTMRLELRRLERHITALEPERQIEIASSKIDQLRLMSLELDEKSKDRPAYFSALPASELAYPDDKYDLERNIEYYAWQQSTKGKTLPIDGARAINHYFRRYASGYYYSKPAYAGGNVWSGVEVDEGPYVNLYRYDYPEFGTTDVQQVRVGPYPHAKTTIYNNLDADDEHIIQGELLSVLRLMIAQLRRVRFLDHVVAPVLAFSFMGPQHARVIEAYMDGHTVVVRPSKLFDLRTKDPDAFRTMVQWYFSKPIGHTLPLAS